MYLNHPSVTAEVGDLDFYVCHETRAAPHIWLYVIDFTIYISYVTPHYRFWVSPLGWCSTRARHQYSTILTADDKSAYDTLVCFLAIYKGYKTYRAKLGPRMSLMLYMVR